MVIKSLAREKRRRLSTAKSKKRISKGTRVKVVATLKGGVETIKTTRDGVTTITVTKRKKGKRRAPTPIDVSKTLQLRQVEAKTGRVIKEGQFKVDPATERKLQQQALARRIERTRAFKQIKALGIAKLFTPRQEQRIFDNLSRLSVQSQLDIINTVIDIDKLNISKIAKDKKKKTLLEKVSDIKLDPLSKEIKQTTTVIPSVRPIDKVPITFKLKGLELVRRGFAGEKTINTAFGVMIVTKDGKLRQPTKAEQKGFRPSSSISLNPLNIVTGFLGVSKGAADFLTTTGRTQKIKQTASSLVTQPNKVLEQMMVHLATDPFGFYGETLAFGAGTKVAIAGARVPLKLIKKTNSDRLKLITNEIKLLKDKGINTRTRGINGEKLRLLLEEQSIIKLDLLDLNKAITIVNKKPKTPKQAVKQINDIKKSGRIFKARTNKRISNQKKKIKFNKLSDIKKSQLLGNLFKPKLKPAIKIKKGLPQSQSELLRLVNVISKRSGTEFKRLKKRIKKETGLNVKQRKGKFLLLEPKKIKIKPLTGKKAKVKTIKLESVKQKVSFNKFEKSFENKKSLRQLDKELKSLELEIKRGAVRKKRFNKKAQTNIFNTVSRHYKVTKRNVKTINNTVKKFNKKYRRRIVRIQQKIKNNNRLTKQDFKMIKTNKTKSKKLKQQLTNQKSMLSSLSKIVGVLSTTYVLSDSLTRSLIRQDILLAQDIKSIQVQSFDPIKPKPKPSRPSTPPKIQESKQRLKRIKKKPTTTIKPLAKPPKKPPVSPSKKPITKPKPKSIIDWDKNPTKGKLGAITFKVGRKTKTIRTGLPYNKALILARETIDNTILASMKVKAYGKTRKKDTRTPNLKKFRVKRGKNVLVQELVEKSKHRLDTRGELSGIKISKFIKKKMRGLNRK